MAEPYSTAIWVARIQGMQSHLRIIAKECEGSDNPHVKRLCTQAKKGIVEADMYISDCEWEEDAYGRIGERADCSNCNGTGLEYNETCVICGGYGWVNK